MKTKSLCALGVLAQEAFLHQGNYFIIVANAGDFFFALTYPLINSGRDTTTRIWKLASTSRSEEIDEPIVMNYDKENPTDKQVTTIDWNVGPCHYFATSL